MRAIKLLTSTVLPNGLDTITGLVLLVTEFTPAEDPPLDVVGLELFCKLFSSSAVHTSSHESCVASFRHCPQAAEIPVGP